MPKYQFRCDDCGDKTEKMMSVSDYQISKTVNNKCIVCGAGKLSRIFVNTNSNIERSLAETLDEIKEDVKLTVAKVKSGDISSVADIYGEEINKLKFKDSIHNK